MFFCFARSESIDAALATEVPPLYFLKTKKSSGVF